MPTVQSPKTGPEYHAGRPKSVISVAPVQLLMVKYTDAQSRECNALCVAFGKLAEDGGLGVFALSINQDLNEDIRMLPSYVVKGVRHELAITADPALDDLPRTEGISPTALETALDTSEL